MKSLRSIMECPHCNQKISGRECPGCGREIPLESRYCMICGAEVGFEDAAAQEGDEFDLENRVLCPDGACTGIIIDGRCIECGRPYEDNQ
jgi:hypothetical protein